MTGKLGLPAAAHPLGMVLTGTAGTGKTVDNREMVRKIGRVIFLLLAPTVNAACGMGGQV